MRYRLAPMLWPIPPLSNEHRESALLPVSPMMTSFPAAGPPTDDLLEELGDDDDEEELEELVEEEPEQVLLLCL